MKDIRIKKITWPTFNKEEFNQLLLKDYKIIKNDPCTDIKFIISEEHAKPKEFNYILNLIKSYSYHCNTPKREDVKGLPFCFVYPPFVIEPDLIADMLGYYFYKMQQYFDVEKLMNHREFNDLEYYTGRAERLYNILKDEDIEDNLYYIELANYH